MARSSELQDALERFWLIDEFDSHHNCFTGIIWLNHNPLLREIYVKFMKEYIALNHMQLASDFDSQKTHYVIPHHGVLRSESMTTKLRVVFDASCKTTSNISLNELLMIGPSIQQNLILSLLAIRLHRHALVADICKMYRQFEISPDDLMYQLVLWRESSAPPLELFQLNTVTNGMSCAPFLAIRSLKYIADNFSKQFPIGAAVLNEEMFVEDLLTEADSVEV
ncbi:uncharacterized protein LOC128266046 [Drosophila gunungcola]|uniref:uncharacterized protein LOC128266046 n=1 Tax=Drosophila gunungcola TaxID=103775 RepID=UPI0022E0FD52|nr:uncharacterized protein LOC128266046 [Drosophila gunungcola]